MTEKGSRIDRNNIGRLIVQYIDDDGQRYSLDLTAEIERIAEEKVMDHMKKWHGQNL